MKWKNQKSKLKFHTKTAGYTLVEILVAMTIIGLLFSFGYISFRDFSRRQQVIGAVKAIQGDLRLAQSDAISGQKPASGCNTTLGSYSFKVYSSSRYTIEANCGASFVIVKDITLVSGIAISTPSPNPLSFKVLSQGTNIANDTDWVITLTQTEIGNVATVTVTAGGEIK